MTVDEFNICVDKWADAVYRFILKSTKNNELSQDIVQDSFEKLWIKRLDVDSSKSKSYLFTTAYHVMIDKFRKNKNQTEFLNVSDLQLSHSKQYSDLSEILNEGLSKLSEVQRSVILLRDYEGYNYREIGEIVGLNESQVKVYIYRARVFLKQFIGSLDAVI